MDELQPNKKVKTELSVEVQPHVEPSNAGSVPVLTHDSSTAFSSNVAETGSVTPPDALESEASLLTLTSACVGSVNMMRMSLFLLMAFFEEKKSDPYISLHFTLNHEAQRTVADAKVEIQSGDINAQCVPESEARAIFVKTRHRFNKFKKVVDGLTLDYNNHCDPVVIYVCNFFYIIFFFK